MSKPQFKRQDVGDEVDVLVDGVKVGSIRKHNEWYGNLGRRGVRYTYFDFYAPGQREKLACASTRKAAVAEALVLLGHYEAALACDPGTARHYAQQAGVKL